MKDLEFINSQIRVMQEQEKAESYRIVNYLRFRTQLGSADRQALCNWGYQTIVACSGVNRFAVVKAISYFDRYMSSSSQCRELEAIQLAFVASLVIALKVDEGFNVELDFVASVITKDAYSEEEISRMEMEILQALEWRLNGPTPHEFIDRYLDAIPGIEASHFDLLNRFSKTVAEVATTTYSFALHYPSVIAFGAICCALEYMESIFAINSFAIQHALQMVSGFNCDDLSLKSVMDDMARFVRSIVFGEVSSAA